MAHFIIASHGTLSKGFKSALNIVAGEIDNLYTIAAYVDKESLEDKVKKIFANISEEDTIVVFTDLVGGSVNQFFLRKLTKYSNMHLIAGANLSLIIEVLLSGQGNIEEGAISQMVRQAREQIVYVNEYQKEVEANIQYPAEGLF